MTRRTDLTHVPQFWCLRTVGWPLLALLIAVGGYVFADRQVIDGLNQSVPTVPGTEPVESADFHGLTAKGDYYSCVRPAEIRPQHPAYRRLSEFCMKQTQERR